MRHCHYDWRPISKDTWDRCWEFAEKIETLKRNWKVTSYFTYYSHFYGILGEALLSNMMGIPYNDKVTYKGDGHSDFLGFIDVKTSTFCSDPHLKVFPNELEDDKKIFTLVGLCLKTKKAKYFGYATTQMLKQAPTINYGKGIRYALTGNDLLKQVPNLEVQLVT